MGGFKSCSIHIFFKKLTKCTQRAHSLHLQVRPLLQAFWFILHQNIFGNFIFQQHLLRLYLSRAGSFLSQSLYPCIVPNPRIPYRYISRSLSYLKPRTMLQIIFSTAFAYLFLHLPQFGHILISPGNNLWQYIHSRGFGISVLYISHNLIKQF